MARRKRRTRFGEVKLKRRQGKIARYVYTKNFPAKKVGIKVFVTRYHADRAGFQAWACPSSSPAKGVNAPTGSHSFNRRGARCGPYGYGRTPTRAVEAALVALAKSHALRAGGR